MRASLSRPFSRNCFQALLLSPLIFETNKGTFCGVTTKIYLLMSSVRAFMFSRSTFLPSTTCCEIKLITVMFEGYTNATWNWVRSVDKGVSIPS